MADQLAALRRAKERAQRRAEELADQIENVEKVPQEDPYPDGTVVRYRRRFTDSRKWYSYAAVRVGGMWWQSGQRAGGAVPWSQYVTWLAEGKIENIQAMEPGGWLIPDGPQPEFDGRPARSGVEETVTVDRAGLERFVADLIEQFQRGVLSPELQKLVDRDRRQEWQDRLAAQPWTPASAPLAPQGEQAGLEVGDLEGDDDPADSCSACGGYHRASDYPRCTDVCQIPDCGCAGRAHP